MPSSRTGPTADERRLRDVLQRAADLVAATTTTRVALQGLASAVDLDVVPEALRGPIATRLATAGAPEPLPAKEVERRLRAAWGRPPGKVLDDLDEEPAAVTPAAQVHRGVLDRAAVAVKVRRPGVAEALRGDLALVDVVAPLFAGLLPAADVGALAREVRERALDELDLEHEAAVQRTVARALRRHPDLVVPVPRTDLSHEGVLVADWVEGTPVRDLGGAPEVDRRRVAELAVRFFLGGARLGTVHADAHPDDVLLLADGRVAVLDFGASARVAPERADRAADALQALAGDDASGLGAALDALGWLPAADGPAAHRLGREVLGDLLGPSAVLDAAAVRATAERGLRRVRHGLALAGRAPVPPADLWPLRGAGALGLLLARLEVRADWVSLALRALREGP
jgi:hypothetical protein